MGRLWIQRFTIVNAGWTESPAAFPAAKRSVNETRIVPRVSVQYSLRTNREGNVRVFR